MSSIEEIKAEQPIFYQIIYNELKSNKKNHAFLIEGNEAKKYALFLIKSLLCQEEELYCDKCRICRQIDQDSYIDMYHYDGKIETIKKNTIEKLQEQLFKTSVEGHGKVYLIENIENSTTEAINSLLKILEEPEQGIYAVFTTENRNRVLPTILSRCQTFKLRPLNKKQIKEKLLNNDLEQETIQVLLNIESSYDKMIELANQDKLNDLIIEAMNFIEDYYYKHSNLSMNTQINLGKKYKERNDIALFLDLLVLGFKDIINNKHSVDLVYCNHPFLKNIEDNDEDLLKKIEMILQIKNDLNYNTNVALTIDRLTYSL